MVGSPLFIFVGYIVGDAALGFVGYIVGVPAFSFVGYIVGAIDGRSAVGLHVGTGLPFSTVGYLPTTGAFMHVRVCMCARVRACVHAGVWACGRVGVVGGGGVVHARHGRRCTGFELRWEA